MLSPTALRALAPVHAAASPAHPTTAASAARSAAAGRRTAAAVVGAVRNYDSIPKREPFSSSRSIFDEFLRQDKPLVQRTKDQITDYCTSVEGDECCSCWDAYFELNKLEEELPKEEIARMVKDSEGDVRYLISSIHHRSNLRKKMAEKAPNSVSSSSLEQKAKPRPFPVPDGLPKTQEELDEEEDALMPESPYTRLLRRMGRYPDWYTPRPDHETD
ncbi:CCG-binding protein 1-like [Phragmites australis]|uniref:CCG-binding protein 1-like n=1 Tax=Phragmites australis TaxID=29695 RepID=UPI002D788C3A|nr:CCG-binding protein 1-like [Phragmites australis]